MKKYKNGLVLGKFHGLHSGHIYLIDTAISNCDHVDVMLCHNSTQTIPGQVRYDAMKAIYSLQTNVTIHLVDDTGLPQHEDECGTLDEFYSHWVPFVYKTVKKLDVVFTSEDYGNDFARYLGIKHVLVDKDRKRYPISGTMVRTNPLQYWDYIPDEIKHYFVKRVVIMGPESVGKSTLTKKLATRFNTNFVIGCARACCYGIW